MRLLCCLLAAAVLSDRHPLAGADDLTILEEAQVWREARQTCQSQGNPGSCDLISRERLETGWDDLPLSVDGAHWVGGRRLYQWYWEDESAASSLPLFQHHGCYRLQVEAGHFITQAFNAPDRCYTACRLAGLLYLQGNKCYCSSSLEGLEASSGLCDVPCDGSDVMCGSKGDYFSVYSSPDKLDFVDQDVSVNCVVGSVRGSSSEPSLFVQASSCQETHYYFCHSDLNTDPLSPKRGNYQTAVAGCAGPLLGLSGYNETRTLMAQLGTLTGRAGLGPVTVWMPLRRVVRAVWVDGERGEEGGTIGNCISATPSADSANYTLSDFPCSQARPAICYCITDTETTEGPLDTTQDTDDQQHEEKGRNIGAIVAVAVIAFVIVVVVVLVVARFIYLRRKSSSLEAPLSNGHTELEDEDKKPKPDE